MTDCASVWHRVSGILNGIVIKKVALQCPLALYLMVGIILACYYPSGAFAQPAQLRQAAWCTPEQLDLNLGPQSASSRSSAQWLTVEISNRDHVACKLPPFSLGFVSDDAQIWGAYDSDPSPTAGDFKGKSNLLAPGDLVHLLVVWNSSPIQWGGIAIGNCTAHDGLEIYAPSASFRGPALQIRHLSVSTCDQGWSSSYRPGPYVPGEPVAKEWLERAQLHESDFAGTTDSLPRADFRPTRGDLKFWTLFDVQYLNGGVGSGYYGNFPMFLSARSRNIGNCPFQSLSKREANGQTTIYLTHCSDGSPGSTPKTKTTQVGFFDTDFALAPKTPGKVEYEVHSELAEDGKIVLAKARLELAIRDPGQPLLPVIDTNTANCRAPQLKLTDPTVELGKHWNEPNLVPPEGEVWYDGKAFELSNVSEQSCMLGGVPKLKFIHPPEITQGGLDPPVCRNCPTPLFKPRESRWIELKPGESAHFLVARAFTSYWPACTLMGAIEMRLPEDLDVVHLPFAASFCGEIAVSSWRAGKYDDDPMNLEWDRVEELHQQTHHAAKANSFTTSKIVCAENSVPVSKLPPSGPRCADVESLNNGNLAMSAAVGEIAFGVSSLGESPAKVFVWMDNQTDQPQPYYMCCRASFLKAFSVYDSSGHLLLSKGEQYVRKIHAEGQEAIEVCSCSSWLSVPPHTMQVVDSGDLSDGYTLPPGRFFIVPQNPSAERPRSIDSSSPGLKNALKLSIPE